MNNRWKNKIKKKNKKFKPNKSGPVRYLFRKRSIEDSKFFNSREWMNIRYFILRKYGRVCMLCGAIGGEVHVDHIKPRSKFPEIALSPNNLQVLCKECNLGKGNYYNDDFRGISPHEGELK